MPVRVGVHVGNAKEEAGDFFAHTVVFASRVAAAAQGGEILVSAPVKSQLEGAFSFGAAKTVALKGLGGGHALFPVLWR